MKVDCSCLPSRCSSFQLFPASLLVLLLAACDSGELRTTPAAMDRTDEVSGTTAQPVNQTTNPAQSNSGDQRAEQQESALLTGIFLDSPVANLAYSTASQSGFTDERGRFNYLANEKIIFSIGDIELPEVIANDTITPADLFPQGAVNHRGVVNVSRLLQTLDADNDPSNGIVLDQWTHSINPNNELDFESTNFSTTVNDLISTHSGSSRSLVAGSEAIAHLAHTLVSNGIPVNIADEDDRLILLDTNTNGIPDNFDWDDDGDGVFDSQDSFPLDPSEQFDTDNDGLGNNVDPDDDNDGHPDVDDAFPLSKNEHKDTDNDGIGNHADNDDDNDGTTDSVDAYPLDKTEQLDSDNDGTGNNSDPDDDNDGYPDSEDAFPFSALEWLDTDGDGFGDNSDSDDDSDGVLDIVDAFPRNILEFADTDNDGIGNNADPDDDGDGIPDESDTDKFTGSNTPPNLTVPSNMVISNRVSAEAILGVSDAENNTVRISWTVESSPADGDMTLLTNESFTKAVMQASVIGRYVIGVSATDGIDSTYRSFVVEVANSAPILAGISIEPAQPTTEMYLEPSHAPIEDADGDNLEVSYTWIVNGRELDYNWSSLPPGEAVKGDKVTLRLDVSDGTHEVSATSDEVVIENSPPTVQSVEILPSQATVSDELIVSFYSLSDADGDNVELSYTWTVNGSVLTDQTENSIPAGIATYQDEVTVQVTLSDTIDTVQTDPVSIEMSDAPSVFNADSVPVSLSYGTPVSFTAMFVDPDGTATETTLVSAPQGLTYDSATNTVSWTPVPLMLQNKEMFVAYFASSDDQIASIDLNVVDDNRGIIMAKSGIEVPRKSQPLDTGDFDGDGTIEVLSATFGQRIFTLELDGNEIVQDWMYPFAFGTNGEIRSVWAHGDDQSQILVVTENDVLVIESREAAPVNKVNFETEISTSRHADLDGDGVAELVIVDTSGELTALNTDTWDTKWPKLSLLSSSDYGASSYALELANVDTDTNLEIITSTGDVIDGATGAVEWKHTSDFGLLLTVGDIDGDGDKDIVGSARWDKVTSYDVATQSSIWEYDLSDTCALKMINIDGDVQDELIHGGCQHGRIEIYDGATGTAVMQEFIDDPDFNSGFTSLTVADIDNDGFNELVFGTGTGSTAEDNMVFASIPSTGDTTPGIAINTNPSQSGAFYMAGWDTVTTTEDRAVFVMPDTSGSQDGQRVGMLSESGAYTVSEIIDWNWDNLNAAKVVDSNNDGIAEIFLATARTYDGRLVHLQLNDFSQLAEHVDSEEARSIALGTALNGSIKAVVASSDAKLRVYDIASAVTDWTSGGLTGSLQQAITRSTSDGFQIIASTNSELTVWTPNTTGYTKSYTAAVSCTHLEMFEVENEEFVGCVSSPSSYSSSPSTFIVFNTQLVKQLEVVMDYQITAIESTNGQQLLIGTSETVDGQSYYSSEKVYNLRLLDPTIGSSVWTSMPLVGRINGIAQTTDPDTGAQKVAIATSAAMYITD